jgi:hypothetical protein
MCKDKKQNQKRKAEQKMKSNMKKAGFNLAALKREILGYRFHFEYQQPSWNQLLPQAVQYQCSRPMNKEQQHRAMGGNHDQ